MNTATIPQMTFIKRLTEEREISMDRIPATVEALERGRQQYRDGVFTKERATRLIEDLKCAPYRDRPATQRVEPGYYVRGQQAYKVQQNKAKTGVYALAWMGQSWEYAPGLTRDLVGMEPMTAEQVAHLGLQSGRCINCLKALGGETLTARVAAVIGYGETCATNNGWTFPKGAAAQRAYLTSKEN